MEPLIALSLASSVVQLVDFGSKIVSTSRELKASTSGALSDGLDLEAVTKDLSNICARLRQGLRSNDFSGPLQEDDQHLLEMCNASVRVSEDLSLRLGNLKIKEDSSTFKTLRQAVKTIWSQKELDELQSRLNFIRCQMTFHVLISVKQKIDLLAAPPNLRELDFQSQKMLRALEHGQVDFDESLQHCTEAIAGFHSNTMEHNSFEHKETRSVIVNAVNQASRGKKLRDVKLDNWSTTPAQKAAQEAERKAQAERTILGSLRFPHMGERYLRVAKAHEKTFQWIFNDPRPQDRPWSSFANWLRSGKGIYWICGKAGSGKSTLMRFLYDNALTRETLSHWSGIFRLNLAGFFFWNSGTAEQKSQMGLLRSLLHEILSRQPELIPFVLPDQWRDEFVTPSAYFQDFHWNVETMVPAFERLAQQENVRICLFIDGLDEYEGDPDGSFAGMIDLLGKISTSGNIKLCVSSRPWLVWEDAFESAPKLRLQDLTFEDIDKYVTDKLKMHARMKQLAASKAKEADELVQELVQKACGVFIWVKLVVSSLLDGLTNRDRISDLRIRLRALPSGIEELYSHMFQHHIPSIYHEQASRLFQIFRAARERTYGDTAEVYLVTLAFADEEDDTVALDTEMGPWSAAKISLRCEEAKCRLKSRCGGLLEVFDDQADPLDSTIQYLHRTVRDFLERPDIWNMLLKRTENSKFSPKTALLQSYIIQLKVVMVTQSGDRFGPVSSLVNVALLYAREAEDQEHSSQLSLLRELDKTATWHWKKTQKTLQRSSQHWAYRCLEEGVNRQSLNPNATWVPAPEDEDNFFSLAIKYGLTHYLQAELFENPELVKKKPGRPLLDYVIDARCSPEPGLVSLLLRSGADPNQIYKGRSTWQHALTFTRECSAVYGPDVNSRWAEVYMHFIHAGANMSTCCKIIDQRSISDMATSRMVFEARLCSPQWILRHMLHRDLRLYALLDARGGTVNNSSLVCGSIGQVTEAARVTSADDCQIISHSATSKKTPQADDRNILAARSSVQKLKALKKRRQKSHLQVRARSSVDGR